MAIREAYATWRGPVRDGDGMVKLASGLGAEYSYGSRFETGAGTNPEELLGAAHASCFSMALAHELEREGFEPELIHTSAKVNIETVNGAPEITEIVLTTHAVVGELDEDRFRELAERAKNICPMSKLVKGGARIELEAELSKPRGVLGAAPPHESAP